MVTSTDSSYHPQLTPQPITISTSMAPLFPPLQQQIIVILALLPLSLADTYFLSCGSSSSNGDGRLFLPDSPFVDPTSSNADNARIFRRPSAYSLPISSPQTPHILRLRFDPFPNLSLSAFSVSLAALPLLTNFSAPAPALKEFLLPSLPSPVLRLSFLPLPHSIAFVTAIELFPLPASLFSASDAVPVPLGFVPADGRASARLLELLYRVNVGGPNVTPRNDTLWRSWLPDDGLVEGGNRGRVVWFSGRIRYPDGGATRQTAPESVYGTARAMNGKEGNSSNNFNLTWILPVSHSDHGYLVRLHFCDIVSKALNELYFDIYINGYAAYKDVDLSSQSAYSLASPYYIDFRVNSSPSGNIRVSVGPSERSLPWKTNAILNGLEIVKIGRVATFPISQTKSYTIVTIGFFLGCLFVVSACLILLLLMLQWRRKTKHAPIHSEFADWSPMPANSYSRATTSSATNANLSLKLPFSEILLATNNFDENSHIGSGGFGKVYKGVLRDGTAVAVKRGGRNSTNQESRQGLTEFYAEILVLSKIRHRHLVSLTGYCEERSEMVLVYEFMEKGPLRDHLYGSSKPHLLWKQRLEICIGSARGLHYLHTGSSQGTVIHRDVKSSNILLDSNYVAKVADFGLSRSAGPHIDQSHVSTGVKGSFGYLDPEYFRTQQLTEKSDVYSFGVVLLEVLCARAVIDRSLSWEEVNLAEWGIKWQKKGLLERIIDPVLKGEIDSESLRKFGETVDKCLSKYGVDRPTMGDVLWNLEYVLQLHESALNRGAVEGCSNSSLEIQRIK